MEFIIMHIQLTPFPTTSPLMVRQIVGLGIMLSAVACGDGSATEQGASGGTGGVDGSGWIAPHPDYFPREMGGSGSIAPQTHPAPGGMGGVGESGSIAPHPVYFPGGMGGSGSIAPQTHPAPGGMGGVGGSSSVSPQVPADF